MSLSRGQGFAEKHSVGSNCKCTFDCHRWPSPAKVLGGLPASTIGHRNISAFNCGTAKVVFPLVALSVACVLRNPITKTPNTTTALFPVHTAIDRHLEIYIRGKITALSINEEIQGTGI